MLFSESKRRRDEGSKRRRDGETERRSAQKAAPPLRLFVSPSLRLSRTRLSRTRLSNAFSLIEIMIVVVIIGLLASVVTYATKEYLDKAKRHRAKADIATFA